jgi:muramoyltetrapeptide carboxypeptidase LdcA involved in peptidoglycan recycling
MMVYPGLQDRATIGVTAPSSGLRTEQHELIKQAQKRLQAMGFQVSIGDTAWTQHKAKSAPAAVRASEWMGMMTDESIHAIIPPWGGELLIEILPYVDFDALSPKWLLGYSDVSVLLLAMTLSTGIATAHGTNLVDLRGETSDETTARWLEVLRTGTGETVVQYSSKLYQKEWNFAEPSPCVYHLTEPTAWKTTSGQPVRMEGRLLGGCVDVIRHLVGTPYGDVASFRTKHIGDDPIVWYFENCELKSTDLRRSLVQMRLAGWFEGCSGLLFGRSPAGETVEAYTTLDIYRELAGELSVPVVYDIDCGHVPPQITFVNGAYAEVETAGGKGTITQHFRP